MKAKLPAKYLQSLNNKNKKHDVGFTLIEILVVIIIIGILSAIALPSFLNQSVKARQSEARTNIGAMNRAQQSYYLENQKFAEDDASGGTTAIDKLNIGIKNSANYTYTATPITAIANNVVNKAQVNNNPELKSYAGGVFASGNLTQSIMCEADTVGLGAVPEPDNVNDCGSGLIEMK